MYDTLLSTHSHTRWLVMVTAILAIALPFLNASGEVNKKSKLPALAFMIMCDIQLLVGLILYFGYSPFGIDAFQNGMSFVMKNSMVRKIAVEHLILMLLAIVLVHIGYVKAKKASDNAQLKKISTRFFGIALIVILAAIPWGR
jgi:heme A synthase